MMKGMIETLVSLETFSLRALKALLALRPRRRRIAMAGSPDLTQKPHSADHNLSGLALEMNWRMERKPWKSQFEELVKILNVRTF